MYAAAQPWPISRPAIAGPSTAATWKATEFAAL